MHQGKIRTWLISCLIVVMVGSLLSACTKEKPILDELGEDGSGTLRVMSYDEESFFREYGSYFAIEYPNIDIEVVDMQTMYEQSDNAGDVVVYDPKKTLLEFIDKEKPDVILTDVSMLGDLVAQGKLYNLDPIIQQEKYDLTGFLPGLIDMLRAKGNDGLYALAPTYNTKALFYNADLFKQHNIEPPHHQMSWQEIFELGARFGQIGSGDDQLYGISNQGSTAADLLMEIAGTANLQLMDARGETVLIDSPGWRDAFNMLINAINSKAIQVVKPNAEGGFSYSSDESAFMTGKAAMMMDYTWTINNLQYLGRWNKAVKPFDWQMVTMPVDPSTPDESNYVSVYNLYAISQDATNKRAAWEFLKFINGDKMAKASSKVLSGQLTSRVTYIKEISGKSAEALTLLKPKANPTDFFSTMTELKIPYDFYQAYSSGVQKAVDELLAGKSSDEVLVPLKQELQQKLIEAKKNAENAKTAENADNAAEGAVTESNG